MNFYGIYKLKLKNSQIKPTKIQNLTKPKP